MSDMLILYVLAATIVIPCIVGLLNFRSVQLSLRFITVLIAIGLGNEILMGALSFLKINNLFAIHFYAVIEVIFLSLFFQTEIESPVVKKLMILGMIALCIFALVYAVNGDNIAQFNSMPRAIECVYFTLASSWLFYEMSNYERPLNSGLYFVNGAIFFYFTSCFLIFTFSKYMATNYRAVILMYFIHAGINAICNLVYAIGLWRASRRYSTQP